MTARTFASRLASRPPQMAWVCALFAGLITTQVSCLSDEALFTQNRLEDPCNSSIPICSTQAACVLEEDEFYEGAFPGGARFIIRTQTEEASIIVRFLLTEPLYPGTEILVQAHDIGCGDLDEAHPQDIDLFDLTGDDRILEFPLKVSGRGDHLLEIFSDMSSTYILNILVEEELP